MMGECSATANSQKAGYGIHTPGDWIIDDASTEAKHKEYTVCGYATETVEDHTCSWDNGVCDSLRMEWQWKKLHKK